MTVLVPADGVHLPVRVVGVRDVGEAVEAPRHPLHEPLDEVVEGDGGLHDLVPRAIVAAAEEHHAAVPGEVAVGDGDGGGSPDDVDEPVGAAVQWTRGRSRGCWTRPRRHRRRRWRRGRGSGGLAPSLMTAPPGAASRRGCGGLWRMTLLTCCSVICAARPSRVLSLVTMSSLLS
ncbi:hypothetical protein SEVIR_4G031901v4 [Setaria viridis]